MFIQNGYRYRPICHAVNPPYRRVTPREDLTVGAFMPFVGPAFIQISRLPTRLNIKTIVGLLCRKVASFLLPVRDDIGLKTLGITASPASVGMSSWTYQLFC
jgi:hypothetical protein